MTTGTGQPRSGSAGWPPPEGGAPQEESAPAAPAWRGKARLITRTVTAAAALALVGGSLAACSTLQGGSGDSASGTTAHRLWNTSGVSDNLVGLWTTSSTIVRVGGDAVVGYDPATGKRLFSVAPPQAGLKPCYASPSVTPSGIGSVVYSRDGEFDCSVVAGIDAKSGRMVWSGNTDPATVASTGTAVTAKGSTFTDGTTAVAATDNGHVFGVNASSGHEVWSYHPSAGNCAPDNTAGAGHLVVVQESCVDAVGNESTKYVAVDSTTGKDLWQTPAEKNYSLQWVVSTDPLVLLVSSSHTHLENNGLTLASGAKFIAFDSSGHQTATVTADATAQGGTKLNNLYPTAVIAGTTLYANTVTPHGEDGDVTAYDLAHGGAKLWSYLPTESGDATDAWVIGVAPDGRTPLVGEDGHGYRNPSPIHELDPGTGKATTLYTLPSDVDALDSILTTAPNGDRVLAPENPAKDAPGISVFALK